MNEAVNIHSATTLYVFEKLYSRGEQSVKKYTIKFEDLEKALTLGVGSELDEWLEETYFEPFRIDSDKNDVLWNKGGFLFLCVVQGDNECLTKLKEKGYFGLDTEELVYGCAISKQLAIVGYAEADLKEEEDEDDWIE